MSVLLKIHDLWKTYPKEKNSALCGVSFEVEEGEIFGLLGPNGAGKSTLINIIAGLLSADRGSISVFGKDLFTAQSEEKGKMNICTTYANLPYPLTVEQNLRVFALLYGIPNREQKIDEVLTIFQIQHLKKKKTAKLSAGENAKVNLAKAFLNDPKFLLLDEPTSSLDPEHAIMIRRQLKTLKHERKLTILWTSHNMLECEEVCDRIAFLLNGKIYLIETPENLLEQFKATNLEDVFLKIAQQQKI